MGLLKKKAESDNTSEPISESEPEGGDSKKAADIIINQIGEMNTSVNKKIHEMEKGMKASTMDLNNLNSSIEGYEERLNQIENPTYNWFLN